MCYILPFREGVKVEKKKCDNYRTFFTGGRGVRGHYRTFNFNSKMIQFVQKCKEKFFPLVRGGGGKRGLRRNMVDDLSRT